MASTSKSGKQGRVKRGGDKDMRLKENKAAMKPMPMKKGK